MLLVDTDVLIDIQRGHPAAVAWQAGLPTYPSVPGFVVMELMQAARNARELRACQRVAAPLPVIWPLPADCAQALTLFASYHLSHGLGLVDALIGATAVGLGAELCTFNLKHFRAVPGLVVRKPYTR